MPGIRLKAVYVTPTKGPTNSFSWISPLPLTAGTSFRKWSTRCRLHQYPFTVGGGLRLDDIQDILLGRGQGFMNTSAVSDPSLVQKSAERFGSQCIVVAIDSRRDGALYRGP
jgi:hypothetical protein